MGGKAITKKGGNMPKPKLCIAGVPPFFSMTRGSVVNFSTDHVTVDVTLPLSSLTDPVALEYTVLRLVLHKSVRQHQQEQRRRGTAAASSMQSTTSSSVDEAAVDNRIMVDIIQMSPMSHTVQQIAGTGNFRVSVLVTVRVAEVASHGMLVGVAVGGNERPYKDTFRVRLLDTSGSNNNAKPYNSEADESSNTAADAPVVLCRCGEDEPVSSGNTVLIGVEPNLIKSLAVRPPRVSPGSWTRETTDVHTLEMVFEIDMEKQLGNGGGVASDDVAPVDPSNEGKGPVVDVPVVKKPQSSTRQAVARPTPSLGKLDDAALSNKRQRLDDSDDE
jgi:hypothetical protein